MTTPKPKPIRAYALVSPEGEIVSIGTNRSYAESDQHEREIWDGRFGFKIIEGTFTPLPTEEKQK